MVKIPSFFRHAFQKDHRAHKISSHIDLPELLLSSGEIAGLLQRGYHNGRRTGEGNDFWQFRPHLPHEPASLIDWKQSARSPSPDLYWVRERELSTPRPLTIWIDTSPSMRWHSSEKYPSKQKDALTCALALAQAALKGSEKIRSLNHKHYYKDAKSIPKLIQDLIENPHETPLINQASPHETLLLISDFMWNKENINTLLTHIHQRPGRTAFLTILDPVEKDFPFSGHLMFTSPEEKNTSLTFSETESLAESYSDAFKKHFSYLSQCPTKGNIPFIATHITNTPSLPILSTLHTYLRGNHDISFACTFHLSRSHSFLMVDGARSSS